MKLKLKKFIETTVRECLNEQHLENEEDVEIFKDALLDLATLSLEDDQVSYPPFNGKQDNHLVSLSRADLYIRNSDGLPSHGPFELFVLDGEDEIGFTRGTKGPKTISFNLIFLVPESRGSGIGYEVYEQFLDDGYTIKSDKEITDGTYSLYLRLLSNGFKPIVFDDGRVGLTK